MNREAPATALPGRLDCLHYSFIFQERGVKVRLPLPIHR